VNTPLLREFPVVLDDFLWGGCRIKKNGGVVNTAVFCINSEKEK
jgi:hypothetical protein